MNLDGAFNGELIGENIMLLSNATVTQIPGVPTPEPGTIAMLGSGIIGLIILGGRRKAMLLS
jgi:hypothetical protein